MTFLVKLTYISKGTPFNKGGYGSTITLNENIQNVKKQDLIKFLDPPDQSDQKHMTGLGLTRKEIFICLGVTYSPWVLLEKWGRSSFLH